MHAVRKANQNSCLCLPGFVSRTYENLSIAQINRIPSEQTMNQKLYCSCSSFQRWLIFAWSHSSFWSRAGKLRPRYQAKAWSLFALVIFVWWAALTKKCVSKKKWWNLRPPQTYVTLSHIIVISYRVICKTWCLESMDLIPSPIHTKRSYSHPLRLPTAHKHTHTSTRTHTHMRAHTHTRTHFWETAVPEITATKMSWLLLLLLFSMLFLLLFVSVCLMHWIVWLKRVSFSLSPLLSLHSWWVCFVFVAQIHAPPALLLPSTHVLQQRH